MSQATILTCVPGLKDSLRRILQLGLSVTPSCVAAGSDEPVPRSWGRKVLRGCGCLTGGFVLLLLLGFILLQRVPKSYPALAQPLAPPASTNRLGGGLDGFDSPYLGHTGSWDGKGGSWGGTKLADMDVEKWMGLRWTFMPVHWRAMEPDGPVDLSQGTPSAWLELDEFVRHAHKRRLNILMQAPVVGGNGGGPPRWAGRRQPGKSAPTNMTAAVEFAAKLATRYAPNGTLAQQEKWQDGYGVRAWELDNEPESYRTNWKGQAGDYAELVTKVAARIREADHDAVIVGPAIAGGRNGLPWLEDALAAQRLAGSPVYRAQGTPYSIGKALDVVSFHCYEGLETVFSGRDRTIESDLADFRAVFEKYEKQPAGFDYRRKEEYWHTEGNYDFLGVMLSRERRAAWRIQFFTRGFAAGIRKLCVMDASRREQIAVRTYIKALPNPFPMLRADNEVTNVTGKLMVFRHPDGAQADAGRVWVVWALAGTGPAAVEVPVVRGKVEVFSDDGQARTLEASAGHVRLKLKGDDKMAPPLILVDRLRPSAP